MLVLERDSKDLTWAALLDNQVAFISDCVNIIYKQAQKFEMLNDMLAELKRYSQNCDNLLQILKDTQIAFDDIASNPLLSSKYLLFNCYEETLRKCYTSTYLYNILVGYVP